MPRPFAARLSSARPGEFSRSLRDRYRQLDRQGRDRAKGKRFNQYFAVKKNENLNSPHTDQDPVGRRVQSNNDNVALGDLHYERFRRITGLFDTVPASANQTPAARHARERFGELRQEIEGFVVSAVDSKKEANLGFGRDDASDYVHNLNLLLVQVLPVDLLEYLTTSNREDLREMTGPESFQRYCQSASYQRLKKMTPLSPGFDACVRADATFVVNELRRQSLQQLAVEKTRRYLIRKLGAGWAVICGMLGTLAALGFAGMMIYSFDLPDWLEKLKPFPLFVLATGHAIILLSLAGISGAFGSCLSAFMRIQGLGGNGQLGRNLNVLSYSATVLRFTALYGMSVALLLSFLIAGGLVAGGFFPTIPKDASDPWNTVLFHGQELAKWLFWTFFAGFSERFVPDMIDRVTTKARDDEARKNQIPMPPPPPPAEPAPGRATRPAPPTLEWVEPGLARANWAAFPDAKSYVLQVKVMQRDANYKPYPTTQFTTFDVPSIPVESGISVRIEVRFADGTSIFSDASDLAPFDPAALFDEINESDI